MTGSGENPFVMPGMGQSNPDLAANPLLAGMEMMQQAWAGMSGAGGWTQNLPLAAALDPDALDKRIAELKSVESWLSMNLSMLSSAIQGLQVQRATIHTLRSFAEAVAQAPQSADPGQSPLEAVLGIRRPAGASKGHAAPASAFSGETAFSSDATQGARGFAFGTPDDGPRDASDTVQRAGFGNAPDTASDSASDTASDVRRENASEARAHASSKTGQQAHAAASSDAPTSPGGAAHMAAAAPQAWFEALQSQFNQLAAATLASMPAMGAAGVHAAGVSKATGARKTADAPKTAGASKAGAASRTAGAATSPASTKPRNAAPPKKSAGATKRSTAQSPTRQASKPSSRRRASA